MSQGAQIFDPAGEGESNGDRQPRLAAMSAWLDDDGVHPAVDPDDNDADEEYEVDDDSDIESDDVADLLDGEDPEREASTSLALFEGDAGGLEAAQRRALVVLLKHRFISAQTHPKEWRAVVAKPILIRSRLNDMFLELVLDADREVAYKRQVSPEGGGRFPTLLHDTPWGREDTLLLVYLRSRFRSEQASGAGRVFVDRADMLEFVDAHRPEHATDRVGDAKRSEKGIETLFKAGLLIGPSTGDRFEVSRAIEVLLPMDKLRDLLAWLQEQNGTSSEPDEPLGGEGNRNVGG